MISLLVELIVIVIFLSADQTAPVMAKELYKNVNSVYGEFNIHVEFESNSFVLSVYQNSKAYSIYVSPEELQKSADNEELDIDEYYDTLKLYLTQESSEVELNFVLSSKVFSVNNVLINGMKSIYFSCTLEEVPLYEKVIKLLTKLYVEKCIAVENLAIKEEKLKHMEARTAELENKLEEFLNRKSRDEEQMFNHFLLLLNEKKTHIQHLNETLIAFKHGRPTLNPQQTTTKRLSKNKSSAIKQEIKEERSVNNNSSSSENEDRNDNADITNYNTDEEKEKKLLYSSEDDKMENDKQSSPMPSTSKQDFDFLSDESMTDYNLPKRLKSNNSSSVVVSNKPSTSTKNLPTHGQKRDTTEENNRTYVNFNTQDLLDNLI